MRFLFYFFEYSLYFLHCTHSEASENHHDISAATDTTASELVKTSLQTLFHAQAQQVNVSKQMMTVMSQMQESMFQLVRNVSVIMKNNAVCVCEIKYDLWVIFLFVHVYSYFFQRQPPPQQALVSPATSLSIVSPRVGSKSISPPAGTDDRLKHVTAAIR